MIDYRKGLLGWPVCVSLAMCAHGALAGDTATEASSNSGPMSFPNVVLENAPQATNESTVSGAAGMRAYIDEKTGKLREQRPEDMQREGRVPSRTPSAAKRYMQSDALTDGAEVEMTYGPGNTVGIRLGSSTMAYQVAQRDSDGELKIQCLTGEQAANQALQQAPASEAEHSHDTEVQHDR